MELRRLLRTTLLSAAALLVLSPAVQGAQELSAAKVDTPPVLDGSADGEAWAGAKAIAVKDGRTGGDIALKAVRSGDMVYFLVQFHDKEENRLHKPWVWDKEMNAYQLGPQREDGFSFKWNMEDEDVNLSNFSDDSYLADVWYWKANRTDPAGYADDKHHHFGDEGGKKSKELTSPSGKKRFLTRNGDEGKAAQKKVLPTDYKSDVEPQYVSQKPDGGRADVLAKGVWANGTWTVEFGRKLVTGDKWDVKFDPAAGKKYLFGVSIFGLYGNDVDDSKAHWYGQGRISEPLYLVFP